MRRTSLGLAFLVLATGTQCLPPASTSTHLSDTFITVPASYVPAPAEPAAANITDSTSPTFSEEPAATPTSDPTMLVPADQFASNMSQAVVHGLAAAASTGNTTLASYRIGDGAHSGE